MHRRTSRLLLASTAAAALAFAPIATSAQDSAQDEDGVTAELGLTDVTVADGDLEVSGTFDFGGAVDMGEDDAGDATLANAGLDLSTMTLEQTGRRLRVELRVHDATPTVGIPDVSRYWVPLPASGLGSDVELHVWTSAAWQGAVAEPFTSVDVTADGEFTSTAVEGGVTEDGTGFYWDLSLGQAGLSALDVLSYPTATTGTGALGFGKLNGGASEHDSYQGFEEFALGGDVQLALLDADGVVVANGFGVVLSGNEWDADLDIAELPAGEYTLQATADYATAEAVQTATVTIG